MIRLSALVFVLVLSASFSLAAEKAMLKAVAEEQKPASAADSRTTTGALIDINSASEKQLKAIKGIGLEYSERIVAGRPYYTQEQLVTRKVIPKEIYETVKDQIIAKQSY